MSDFDNMRHLPQMFQHVEDEIMRGARVDTHYNRHYPDGVRVYTLDNSKARFQGRSLEGNPYLKRKVENLFIMNNPKQKLKVCFT